jgi:hypothetical protein
MVHASTPQQDVTIQSMVGLKRWVHALLFDGRIGASWLFLFGGAFLGASLLSGGFGRTEAPFNTTDILRDSALCGYWVWSLYWGLPPARKFSRRVRNRLFLVVQSPGCAASILVFVAHFIALVCYPLLGGGLFHFVRQWWYAGTHVHPVASIPAAAPPPPVGQAVPLPPPALPAAMPASPQPPVLAAMHPEIEQRLRALAQLLERRAITKEEHDQQRTAILRSI